MLHYNPYFDEMLGFDLLIIHLQNIKCQIKCNRMLKLFNFMFGHERKIFRVLPYVQIVIANQHGSLSLT